MSDRLPGVRRRTVWVVALICVVVLSVLAECGVAVPDHRPVFTGVRSYVIPYESSPPLPPPPPDLSDPQPELFDRRIAGPHFHVRTGWRRSSGGLDDRDARQLARTPVRAADGEQLLLVGVDPSADRAPFDEPTAEGARVEVVVDGAVTPVDYFPRSTRPSLSPRPSPYNLVLMIGARPDASVRLRVTDAGRMQELDLRTRGPRRYWFRACPAPRYGSSRRPRPRATDPSPA